MESEEVTRLMAQLAAGLREHVPSTDQWTVRATPIDEPPRLIYVRFSRKDAKGHVIGWDQMVSPDLLASSVLAPADIGRELARTWLVNARDQRV